MLKMTRWAALAVVLLVAAALDWPAAQAQGQAAPAATPPAAAPAATAPAATEAPVAAGVTAAKPGARATEVVDNPYGLEALWRGSDMVAKGTLVILIIMSMGTWYIIITKVYEQYKVGRAARKADKEFWNAPSVKQGADRLKSGSPFRFIAESGLEASDKHTGMLEGVSMNDWITMSIQRAIENVQSRMQDGLAFLATVGSTAPFVGLFGTVFGIINAFVGMGETANAGIGAIAGGIAEALVTTAVGLAVAVPAVWLFNYFTSKVDNFIVEMDNSSAELIDFFLKQRGKK